MNYIKFRKEMRERRLALRMKQATLARRIGKKSGSTISLIETGKVYLSPTTKKDIERILRFATSERDLWGAKPSTERVVKSPFPRKYKATFKDQDAALRREYESVGTFDELSNAVETIKFLFIATLVLICISLVIGILS